MLLGDIVGTRTFVKRPANRVEKVDEDLAGEGAFLA
jgi:hypothetical protein